MKFANCVNCGCRIQKDRKIKEQKDFLKFSFEERHAESMAKALFLFSIEIYLSAVLCFTSPEVWDVILLIHGGMSSVYTMIFYVICNSNSQYIKWLGDLMYFLFYLILNVIWILFLFLFLIYVFIQVKFPPGWKFIFDLH